MDIYENLRRKHAVFIYHSFEFTSENGGTALTFHFSIDGYHFYPRWAFEGDIPAQCDRQQLDEIAFSLGMAELVSYWKCACCPVVEIRCGYLSEWQKRWWKKLYFNGLGEFFYRNGITPDRDGFMTINAPARTQPLAFSGRELRSVMVPVGGGKDSVVTLELMKKHGADIIPYIINPRGATLGCVQAAGIPRDKVIGPKRTIDKTLLELNKQGYLNGHTPFSAVVAFSAALFACMHGIKYIALSNESSANEPYVDGTQINHQYSKSTEFERDFREYCEHSFGGAQGSCPEYFSLLRPWSEWQIAREFVRYPQYFGVFQSCNLGSKTDVWCCNCAKCLYVYILLAAFLTDEKLTEIFGCNMLEKTELADMFDGLVLDGEDKPFECVGTRHEIRLSLDMAARLREGRLPPLLERYVGYRVQHGLAAADLGGFFDEDNFVPECFLPLLKEEN